jgi:hypothetical protein
MSGIGRQAKIPSEHQIQALLAWLETRKDELLDTLEDRLAIPT